MKRATIADSAEIAELINHPTIRPHCGGDGKSYADPAEILADQHSVLLFDEGGGQFFHWKGPGIFEAHSFYLVRGREAIERGREAVARMFSEFGAEKVWRATPIENRRARWFNRQLGFRSLGEIELYGPCELFERVK